MGILDLGMDRKQQQPQQQQPYNPLEDVMKRRDMEYGYETMDEEQERDFFIQFLQFLRDKQQLQNRRTQGVV